MQRGNGGRAGLTAYRLSPDARQDLRDIGLYVGKTWGAATRRAVLAKIMRSIVILGRHPSLERNRDHDPGMGRRSLPSGKQVIIYVADGRLVTVLRVIDGRRDYAVLFRDR